MSLQSKVIVQRRKKKDSILKSGGFKPAQFLYQTFLGSLKQSAKVLFTYGGGEGGGGNFLGPPVPCLNVLNISM